MYTVKGFSIVGDKEDDVFLEVSRFFDDLTDVVEKAMAPHSSTLAWRIPGMGEPGGCCLWDHTESDTTEVT